MSFLACEMADDVLRRARASSSRTCLRFRRKKSTGTKGSCPSGTSTVTTASKSGAGRASVVGAGLSVVLLAVANLL